MGIIDRLSLKNLFKTARTPSQNDYWNWFDSYVHKNDKISTDQVRGLSDALAAKLDTEASDNILKAVQDNSTTMQALKDQTVLKYNDAAETVAADILKLADKATGDNANYRETSVWIDGSPMTDSKADGNIFRKIGDRYYEKIKVGTFNLEMFGMLGTDDDTKTFQLANNIVAAKGGGKILMPEGTYLCNFILDSHVSFEGQGSNVTILKSVPGSNKAVISSRNFAALTGTAKQNPETRGVRYCQLRGFSVDGNKQNNSAGNGIEIWGCALKFSDIISANCAGHGIVTEYTTHEYPADDFSATFQALESNFDGIKTIANNGNGWDWSGPHDADIKNYIAFRNKGWALYQHKASMNGYNWNAWLNSNSFYFGESFTGFNIVASAEYVGTGVEFREWSNSSKIIGLQVGGHVNGIIIRGANHFISGNILSCRNNADLASATDGNAITTDRLSNSVIEIMATQNHNVVNNLGGTSFNLIKGTANIQTGKTFSSSEQPFDVTNIVDLVYNFDGQDAGQAHYLRVFPFNRLYKNGWRPELPDSNNKIVSKDDLADVGTWGLVQAANTPTADATSIINALKSAGIFK